ncbi:TIGR01777 family oxidoreductase [Acidipila rosea]|uniref:TIGR01777 family protein n=1 Tax=Acidipila rosea TaxID=768535 RepID=A0A4V6NES1_9BACT|nr:TIGR01777 family oxidoreductase [Acidipila rosea]MBW4027980.1 TIGR01777 family protein [Acidobacteriota bacterium]MBW4045825.1 TIGR01777 family protein [Acidobacteriota bacterium]TCK71891.1 hypothetical protein C7378_2513 [Acidipila rosea]
MALMEERIILSGGSGMIGVALTHTLSGEGARVVKLVRGKAESAGSVHWDPSSTQPLADLSPLEGARAAIHLSGANLAAHRWTPAYKKEIFASRVESTHAIVRLLQSLRRPPAVLVTASAVGIYGDRGEEKLTEQSAPGVGFLAETCRAWEAAADPATAAGIRVVHTRFGVVLDPHGGALAKVLPLFKAGLGGKLGDGAQWMSWITLGDLVRMVLHLIENPEISGPVNVVAPHPIRNSDYTRALGHALHRPAIMPAPAFALRLALGEMADAALLSSTRALPQKIESAGFRFEHPEIGPALADLLLRS